MNKRHELKTDPSVFAAEAAGIKTHEIRFNDRGFAVGDTLVLRETESSGDHMKLGSPLIYTGRTETRTVSHIQTGYGLADGWCILSFSTAPAQELSALPELPKLSEPDGRFNINGPDGHRIKGWDDNSMQAYARAYGLLCLDYIKTVAGMRRINNLYQIS